jgi:predicted kinase
MSDNPEVITGATGKPPKHRGTLTITVGLPGSGKSTWGEQMRSDHPDRIRIVNMDDIRASNGSQFAQGDESTVQQIRDFMVDKWLVNGYDVICTDTNLSPKTQRRLAQIAKTRKAEFIVTSFTHVSLETCIKRNNLRRAIGDDKVPNAAIHRMYEQFIEPLANSTERV